MMTDKRYTPQLIVDDKIQFSVPLYQRLFAWGEEQIKGLMLDLTEHFLSNKTCEKPYYLGQMTVVWQENRYALIDGQQRFTAMTLFAIALLRRQEKLGFQKSKDWENFILNGERIYFIGRREDNSFLKNLIDSKTEPTYENPRMSMAISLMEDLMPDENIDIFAERVFTGLSFFFAELDESYVKNPSSLNKYFEAMNSTGKGLEQHEILKVELMRNQPKQDILTRIWNLVSGMDKLLLSKEENSEEGEKYLYLIDLCKASRYEDCLNIISDSVYNEDEYLSIDVIPPSNKEPNEMSNNNTEKSIISFPKFLLLVLDLAGYYTGTEKEKFYRPENLNTIFKKYRPDDMHKFYGELLHYRLLLDYYCVHKESGKHVLAMNDDSESETMNCLKQYLSMLDVSTVYYNWLKPYLKVVHDNTSAMNADELLLNIKAIDNSIPEHQLPTDINLMTYGDLQRRRYLFWRLDYYLFERRKEIFGKSIFPEVNMSAIFNYEFRENRSIEHLHPQNENYNIEWVSYNLNNFGNLAMISQSFNSEQSNDPVEVKFARIKEQAKVNELQSLKLYLMYLVSGTKPEGWSESVAKMHGEVMYELLANSYHVQKEQ